MNDHAKTKTELLDELKRLRRRLARLEAAEAKHKKTEEDLRHKQILLQTLVDGLPDIIYAKDASCCKTLSNKADVENMGLQSENDVLGKDDFSFYPREIAERFYTDDLSVIQTGQPVLGREEYVIDADGQKRWLYTSKLPLRDSEGRVIGLIGIGRDITERKEAEEALAAERSLLRTLVDNLPDLIFFKDTGGKYILDNRAHFRSLGAEHQDEIVGKTTFDFNPPELAQRYHDDEMQLVQSGKPLLEIEEVALHRELGQNRWHLTSKIPVVDNHGTVTGIVGIARDITERKRAEEERERLINELQAALADVKTLSGLVPICASCKKIRDDQGFWTQIESYIQARTPAHFSHGICPDCTTKFFPGYKPKKEES